MSLCNIFNKTAFAIQSLHKIIPLKNSSAFSQPHTPGTTFRLANTLLRQMGNTLIDLLYVKLRPIYEGNEPKLIYPRSLFITQYKSKDLLQFVETINVTMLATISITTIGSHISIGNL